MPIFMNQKTPNIANRDPEAYEYLVWEQERQKYELELIASENYVSEAVLEANGSIFTNKYSEGYPGKRYYAGQEWVDKSENLAISRAREIFWAEYINVQPHSGSPANLAVFFALLSPGDTILGMNLDHGWHLSHGHPLNYSGKMFHIIPYGVDKTTELIDMDIVEQLAKEYHPKLIIAGFSAYSRSIDWARFRRIADETGAMLMGDIAHIAGLIAGWALENPVPYCDIVTTPRASWGYDHGTSQIRSRYCSSRIPRYPMRSTWASYFRQSDCLQRGSRTSILDICSPSYQQCSPYGESIWRRMNPSHIRMNRQPYCITWYIWVCRTHRKRGRTPSRIYRCINQ